MDALALFAGEDAVVFDFVQPAGTGGRADDERGLARANEAGRRAPPPARRAKVRFSLDEVR
jgi:hypothetical protein